MTDFANHINPAPGFEKYPGGYGLEIIHGLRSLHQLIVNEAVIAASDRAVILSASKTCYDVLYIPKSDILAPLTRMKGQSSYCPFKGQATYWRFTKPTAEGLRKSGVELRNPL